MTQDTSIGSEYYAASNHTFFVCGGNMTIGEFIDLEVNESRLKKGNEITYSDLVKESTKKDGTCKMILNNTYRVGNVSNHSPSSDNVLDASIKVLAADSSGIALYYYMKVGGHDSHTYVFEGIASVDPATGSSGLKTPATVELDVCDYCYGDKVCPVCHGRKGLSYTTWGQGGSGWVDCAGCGGSGKCKKCGGDGKKHS